MKKKSKKQFKKFVDSAVSKIFRESDLENYRGKIFYRLNEDNLHNSLMKVDNDTGSFQLYIYKGLYEEYQCDPVEVLKTLCCNMGYVHTHDLFKLVQEPYKTKRELMSVDARLARKIGSYLYEITWGKNKWRKRKKQEKHKKQKSSKTQKR